MPASAWASTSVRFFGSAGAPVGRSDYATSCSATGQFWVWCCASFCALLRKAYRNTAPVRPGGQGGAAHWRSGFHPPVRLQPERACALSCVRGQWGVLGSDALRLDYPGAAIGGRPVTLHGRHPARHGERQQWVDSVSSALRAADIRPRLEATLRPSALDDCCALLIGHRCWRVAG